MTVAEYNQAVEDYADNIYRFILKNISHGDKARDIVQDTYEKLWIKHEDVSYQKVKSYLFTTAYHTMIDVTRKERRLTDFENMHDNVEAVNTQYNDVKEILEEAIKKLPEVQRTVILLRDYEGYHYDEIAKITGLTESQVKVYIYRGRMALKKYIGTLEKVI
jgi:RNA polymerase sigma-70 factor (ECF subfamily)